MARLRREPIQRTESIQTLSDSEIQISLKEGVKAEGLISYFALAFFAILAGWYLYLKYGDKAKGHIKKTGRRIKAKLKRKKK
jgi:hypothetical protein